MKYEQPGLLYFAQLVNGQWNRALTEAPPTGQQDGWFAIENAAPPDFDPAAQFCRRVPEYKVVDGKPVADWGVRALTDDDRAAQRTAIKIALRPSRNALLEASDKPVARHRDQVEVGGETTLTAEQFLELLAYRQALRDWPDAAASDQEQPPAAPAFLS